MQNPARHDDSESLCPEHVNRHFLPSRLKGLRELGHRVFGSMGKSHLPITGTYREVALLFVTTDTPPFI